MTLDQSTREIFAHIWKSVVMNDSKGLSEHWSAFSLGFTSSQKKKETFLFAK